MTHHPMGARTHLRWPSLITPSPLSNSLDNYRGADETAVAIQAGAVVKQEDIERHREFTTTAIEGSTSKSNQFLVLYRSSPRRRHHPRHVIRYSSSTRDAASLLLWRHDPTNVTISNVPLDIESRDARTFQQLTGRIASTLLSGEPYTCCAK